MDQLIVCWLQLRKIPAEPVGIFFQTGPLLLHLMKYYALSHIPFQSLEGRHLLKLLYLPIMLSPKSVITHNTCQDLPSS